MAEQQLVLYRAQIEMLGDENGVYINVYLSNKDNPDKEIRVYHEFKKGPYYGHSLYVIFNHLYNRMAKAAVGWCKRY